jgi:glycosyltransferase involved in cell wall biosynthesis
LKIVFFTFYYPPDLCAGSFRAIALAQELSKGLSDSDELHIITTHPNRYKDYCVKAKDMEVNGKITIHRIRVPEHQSGMLLQARTFSVYAAKSYKICLRLNPDFLIGTTSRLMTGVLTGITASRLECRYFIDLRDIFSETISDLFSRKNKLLGVISKLLFSSIEKRLFNNATAVNVVSEGFPEYFQRKGIDTTHWSFFPNGVDREFINLSFFSKAVSPSVKTILYAGNIGSGQGLDTILPEVAKRIGSGYRFLIVGDGGANPILKKEIRRNNVNNIKILPPVERAKLIDYYQEADILFLHLNNIPAFYRVLPSKIFEYAALSKPIVAGLSGYSSQFIKDNLAYVALFNPGDVDGCVESIKKAERLVVNRSMTNNFVKKYSREHIMKQMSKHILSII